MSTTRRPISQRCDYRRAAISHPLNVAALTIVALTAVVMTSAEVGLKLPLMMLLFVEAVVLGVLPKIPAFQRSVEARAAEAERIEAAAARAITAAHLDADHRIELESLEMTAEVVRAHAGVARLAEDWTGASELVNLYGKLALAHRASVATFGPALGGALDHQTRCIQASLACADDTTRPALLRRLAVVRARKSNWVTARRQQEALAIEMAMIGDQIRSMRENCALTPFGSLREELDLAFSTSHEGGRVLREIVEVRVDSTEPTSSTHLASSAAANESGIDSETYDDELGAVIQVAHRAAS
jgi:hypothetical protein